MEVRLAYLLWRIVFIVFESCWIKSLISFTLKNIINSVDC